MENWITVRLGEVANFTNGGAWSQEEYAESGIPVVRVSDIGAGTVDLTNCKYLAPEKLDKYKKHTLFVGDLLVTTVGSHPTQPGSVVGRAARVPSSAAGALLNQNAVRIAPADDALDKLFLVYVGRSQVFRNYIIAHARGSANQVRMSIEALKEMPLLLPPLPIQRKIAAILAAYDDLIENNSRRIKILEEMAGALYREWFVNFRYPGHEDVPLVESELGLVPQGWEAIQYSDLLDTTLGGDWGSEEPTGADICPVTVIRGTDFDEIRSGGMLRAPIRYITASSLEKRRLKAGDIVVENSVNATSRTTGQSLLIDQGVLDRVEGDVICASFCKAFRLKQPELGPLMHLHMKHMYREGDMAFYQNVATNGIGNFQSKRFVDSVFLLMPPDGELRQSMIGFFADMTTSAYAASIDNLRRTRDMLLPRLISGEVDVAGLDIVGADERLEVNRAAWSLEPDPDALIAASAAAPSPVAHNS